jgi:hypothetical protein
MAPVCLDDPGVTIVVVPYRAILDNLIETAKKARIDCIEYRPGEQNLQISNDRRQIFGVTATADMHSRSFVPSPIHAWNSVKQEPVISLILPNIFVA